LVPYSYHFSIIFYGFPKSGRKRKRKKVNSTRLKLAQTGPCKGESAPAHAPAVSILHRGPWSFEKPIKNPLHCFSVSLTSALRPLPFYFFTTPAPRRWTATSRSPASLYHPKYAMTGAPVWLTPNSTPNDHYPSINCKVLAPNLSAHGDSAINGQTEVFLVILRVLAQLAGSSSIKSTQEC
jgi:hypothetical protein